MCEVIKEVGDGVTWQRGVFALVLCVRARWFVLPCLVSPCAISSPVLPYPRVHREPIIRSVSGRVRR